MDLDREKRYRDHDSDYVEPRRRIDHLFSRVLDDSDKSTATLQDAAEKLSLAIASPDLFSASLYSLFRSMFKTQTKMGALSTLAGLVASRSQQLYGTKETYNKAFEFGDRLMRLTVEMLDRYLAGGVWLKSIVLMKFTADLMHAGIVHPQNMWNILREIVNEVQSPKNSSNRRDAYCFMVLSTLVASGKAIADYQEVLKARGLTREAVPVQVEDVTTRSKHQNVDLEGLFENIRDYMNNGRENARHSAQAGERLEQSWIEVSQLYDTKWKGCEETLAKQPYNDPALKKRFLTAIAAPIVTLKRMKARSQKANEKEKIKEDPEVVRQQQTKSYSSKIANVKVYGQLEEGERLYQECKDAKLLPSRNIMVAMLTAYCNSEGDHTKSAKDIFDAMKKEIAIDETEYTLLIKAYTNGKNAQVFDMYNQMKEDGFSPNCNILTLLLHACRDIDNNESKTTRLESLLQEIGKYQLKPNSKVLCAFLSCYRDMDNLDRCLQLIQTFSTDYGVTGSEEVNSIMRSMLTDKANKNLEVYRIAQKAEAEARATIEAQRQSKIEAMKVEEQQQQQKIKQEPADDQPAAASTDAPPPASEQTPEDVGTVKSEDANPEQQKQQQQLESEPQQQKPPQQEEGVEKQQQKEQEPAPAESEEAAPPAAATTEAEKPEEAATAMQVDASKEPKAEASEVEASKPAEGEKQSAVP